METRSQKRLKLVHSSNTPPTASAAAAAAPDKKNTVPLFDLLCDDAFEHILSYMEPDEILPLRVCNKSMNKLVTHVAKETCARTEAVSTTEASIEDEGDDLYDLSQYFRLVSAKEMMKEAGFQSIDQLQEIEIYLDDDSFSDLGSETVTMKQESCVDIALNAWDYLGREGVLIDGLYLKGFQHDYLGVCRETEEIPDFLRDMVKKCVLKKVSRQYAMAGAEMHALNLINHFKLHQSNKTEAFEHIMRRKINIANVSVLLRRAAKCISNSGDRADVARLIFFKLLTDNAPETLSNDSGRAMNRVIQLYREVIDAASNTTHGNMNNSTNKRPRRPQRTSSRKRRRTNFGSFTVETSLLLADGITDKAFQIAESVRNPIPKSLCFEIIARRFYVEEDDINGAVEVVKKIPQVQHRHKAYAMLVHEILDKDDKLPLALQIADRIKDKTSRDFALRSICVKCFSSIPDKHSFDDAVDIASRFNSALILSEALESVMIKVFWKDKTPHNALSLLKQMKDNDVMKASCILFFRRKLEFIVRNTFDRNGLDMALGVSKSFTEDDKELYDMCMKAICLKASESGLISKVIELSPHVTSSDSKIKILHSVQAKGTVNDVLDCANIFFKDNSEERERKIVEVALKTCHVHENIAKALELVIKGIENGSSRIKNRCIKCIARCCMKKKRLFNKISDIFKQCSSDDDGSVFMKVGSPEYIIFLDEIFDFRHLDDEDQDVDEVFFSLSMKRLEVIARSIKDKEMKSRAMQKLVRIFVEYSLAQMEFIHFFGDDDDISVSSKEDLLNEITFRARKITSEIPSSEYKNKALEDVFRLSMRASMYDD